MPTIISSQFKWPSNTNDGSMVVVDYKTAKGDEIMATLSADDITQSGQGYVNNSIVEINNYKSNLAGGDTDTAMVTGDHDSRSTDFTNLLTSREPVAVTYTKGAHPMNAQQPQGYETTETAKTLNCFNNSETRAEELVAYHYAVRRITPVEGERLQGFADGWTRPCFTADTITDELVDRFVEIHRNWAVINGKADAKPPSRKKVRAWMEKISSAECPDGPRYKAIGNSMSVNVMQWIGERIDEADKQERSDV